MSADKLQEIDVFISSPSDLGQERRKLYDMFLALNTDPAYQGRFKFKPFIYEAEVQQEDLQGMGWQEYINLFGQNISHTHLVIGMLWSRLGLTLSNFINPITGRPYRSGTEYELSTAYGAQQNHGLPFISFYRCNRPISLPSDEGNREEQQRQLQLVHDYVQEMQDENVIPSPLLTFQDADDLCQQVHEALTRLLPEIKSRLNSTERFDSLILPALPSDFVARQAECDQIADATQRNHITVLHGLPGQGKTVLARALCDYPSIRSAFPDGIIWATIGQQADRARVMREWIFQLHGNLSITDDTAVIHEELLRCLQDKSVLMVLDDVWDTLDARLLTADLGLSCHVLITTRMSKVLPEITAIELGPMSQLDSRDLLRKASKRRTLDAAQYDEIASRLGNLPLALKIVGARLAQYSWDEISQQLQSDKFADLAAGQRNVFLSLDASVRFLPVDQQRRYHELVIFPPKDPIDEVVVARLWKATAQMTEDAAHYLYGLFQSLALIQNNGTLHDLQIDYLHASMLPDEQKRLHATLISTYGPIDSWGNLTDDDGGYGWRRLAWHNFQADRHDAVRTLLFNASYLQNKIRRMKSASLDADFSLLPNDSAVTLLAKITRLSRSVLDAAPEQLPNQIRGRTRSELFNQVHHWPEWPQPHFQLQSASLNQAGKNMALVMAHQQTVSKSVLSRDGLTILSASRDSTLRLWDARTGEIIHTLQGHTAGVSDCSFNSDERYVLSGSQDHTLRLWDVQSGECLHIYQGHTDEVTSCAFSPNGLYILSSSKDGTMRLWDTQHGGISRVFQGEGGWVLNGVISSHHHYVYSVATNAIQVWDMQDGRLIHTLQSTSDALSSFAFSPDSRYALSASNDTMWVWDLQNAAQLHACSGGSALVTACAFSADGHYALSASGERFGWNAGGHGSVLRLWNVQTGECVQTFHQRHGGLVRDLTFSPDGAYALSASEDNDVRLWSVPTGECLQIFSGHSAAVTTCAFSPDGKHALSTSEDGSIRLWDLQGEQSSDTADRHTYDVYACAFSPDGHYAVTASRDYTLRLWDAQTTDCLQVFQGHTNVVSDCAFSPDGRNVLSASYDATLRLWDISTGRCLQVMQGDAFPVNACDISPDGRFFLSGCGNTNSGGATAYLFDAQTGDIVHTFTDHPSYVYGCLFSPDGRWAATVSADVRLWDVQTGECARTFPGSDPIAFSPDGLSLLTTFEDRTFLWDIENRRCLRSFAADINPVNICAFSPDGRFVLTDGRENVLKLWDAGTGDHLHVFSGHTKTLTDCEFSPDGRFVLSASTDNTLRMWDVQTKQSVMTWQADNPIWCFAYHHGGPTVVVGDSGGSTHILTIKQTPLHPVESSVPRIPITTNGADRTMLPLETIPIERAPRLFKPSGYYIAEGNELFQFGLYEEAILAYDNALSSTKNDARILYNKGVTLTRLGRRPEAETLFHEAAGVDPTLLKTHSGIEPITEGFTWETPPIAVMKQSQLLNPEDAKKQVEEMLRVINVAREAERAQYELGAKLAAQDSYEEALKAFEKAGSRPEVLRNRALMLYFLKRYDEALALYDKILQDNPGDLISSNSKGIVLSLLGRHDEALAMYEQILRRDPTDNHALSAKGKILIDRGRYLDCIPVYDQLLRHDPDDVNAFFYRGCALINVNRFEEGVESLNQALRRDPKHILAYYNKGIALNLLKRNEEALVAFDQALTLNSQEGGLYRNKGKVLAALKRYDEALAAFNKALQLDSQDAVSLREKGTVLAELKRDAEALSSFEQAIQLNPNDADALLRKGIVFLNTHRYAEALPMFEQVIQAVPKFAFGYQCKGDALRALGRNDEAERAYAEARALT